MKIDARAQVHAALGDPLRLAIVDALRATDLTFSEVAGLTGLSANRLAHHLGVLEDAGVLRRRASEADRRRRYLSLDRGRLTGLEPAGGPPPAQVLFVCTHNSARSPFAAAAWRTLTGAPADSAGTDPAARVHPRAVRAAARLGVDISDASPKGYDDLGEGAETIISVCDRARESDLPPARRHLHWSIPDPTRRGTDAAFRSAFQDIETRIRALATTNGQETP